MWHCPHFCWAISLPGPSGSGGTRGLVPDFAAAYNAGGAAPSGSEFGSALIVERKVRGSGLGAGNVDRFGLALHFAADGLDGIFAWFQIVRAEFALGARDDHHGETIAIDEP